VTTRIAASLNRMREGIPSLAFKTRYDLFWGEVVLPFDDGNMLQRNFRVCSTVSPSQSV
jgi:hypothetical protein